MKRTSAFTLIELLVVIAIIGIIAALLLPTLSHSMMTAQQAACQNNVRQLQLGWHLYASDSNERLPHNSSGLNAGRVADNPGWVAGNMWLDSDVGQDLTESTNVDFLVGNQYVRFGSLGGYVKNPAVYHCPVDTSTTTIGGVPLPRVRSFSMNNYMGAEEEPEMRFFLRTQDITAPGPSTAWVFIDERADSINDGLFAVAATAHYAINDLPNSAHHGGSSISFADGHTEYHRWLEPTTNPSMTPNQRIPGGPKPTSASDRDMSWLVDRTTSKK
jgi:prepilin-type N-terminal cleavage/methylation domain-containing protein